MGLSTASPSYHSDNPLYLSFVTLFIMFIHLNMLTGSEDRGAWPWRRQSSKA